MRCCESRKPFFHIAHGDQDTLIRKYKWHKLKGDKAGINEITILLLDTGSHDSVFKRV